MNKIGLNKVYGEESWYHLFPCSKLSAVLAILFFLFCLAPVQAKEVDYINISNPFLNKTPIAITQFKTFNGHAAEVDLGKSAEQILKDGLDFTGYLKVLDPAAFLSNPVWVTTISRIWL